MIASWRRTKNSKFLFDSDISWRSRYIFLWQTLRIMKIPIIETVIEASLLLNKSKFDLEKLSQERSIRHLNDYFQTATVETVLLVAIFQLSSENKDVDREEIAQFLECNPILFFKYENNFESLLKRGLLQMEKSGFSRKLSKRAYYKVHDRVHLALIENSSLQPIETEAKESPVELLTELADIIHSRDNEDVDTLLLIGVFQSFLLSHKTIPLFNNLYNMNLGLKEKICFVLLCEQNLLGKLDVDIDTLGDTIFSKNSDKITFGISLQNNSNALIDEGWVAFSNGGYFSSARLQLTNKSKEFLKPLGLELRLNEEKKNNDLIQPETIPQKKLFFNPSESQQLQTIGKTLKISNHIKTQKRLASQGMRTGICTLLYGAPGTGKTESVYQIAKETGRSLWKVDLTELKSMWFGESQKKVKALFDNYKSLCKEEKQMPILLLNEADAILGIRQANATSGSESANNAIQNIFLDCLEDFEGILFATTNLEKSLDSAFERRFLFKIKFERPQREAQQKIWKAMLKELTLAQSKTLSENYNLSGGEIENVLRKLAMMRVLEDAIPVFETVKTLCKNEQLGLKGKLAPIGYFN